MRSALVLMLMGSAACGITSSGSGTQTLYVEASTEGKPDGTTVVFEVKRAGDAVEGANVYVEDVDGAVAARSLEPKGKKYEAKFPGYVRGIRVKITSGEDQLEAALEGPAPHLVTNPPSGAVVLRGDAEVLTVEWSGDSVADRVRVKADELDEILVEGDPGSQALPLAGLKDGDQKVRVTRETSVELGGGVTGSIWRARYEVDNRFTLKR